MKNFIYIALAILATWLLSACENEDKIYTGPQYVQFADSLGVFPVSQVVDQEFEVVVVTSHPVSEEQFFGIEVNERNSSAKRGMHYEMVSNYIRIEKGSNVGSFRIKGIFENVTEASDSLWIEFNLVSTQIETSPIYGATTRVQLVRDCGFDIKNYIGSMNLLATFPFTSGEWVSLNVNSVQLSDQSILLEDIFQQEYDIKVFFDYSDPLNPSVYVPEQIAFVDGRYGNVSCATVPNMPSYFIPCTQKVVLYLQMYVPRIGSFGVYEYQLQKGEVRGLINRLPMEMSLFSQKLNSLQ